MESISMSWMMASIWIAMDSIVRFIVGFIIPTWTPALGGARRRRR
jgi:hypothetical protein